ncbi:major facilitator superfamily domain-containing protein [Rhodocollybia butyracea]|uniref:Major facilitator superfamily domain-containing protein n=1 Tax=Rhodocollybia butyracea TaxID=206335 RepID=A0A9P5Q9Z7_9AGAR|nr:major facilitator superfamily domain-containing protein [Rhodocollybia butyracea]
MSTTPPNGDGKEFTGEDVKAEVATEENDTKETPGTWFMEEKRLVRKLDVLIMPITCLLYLFAYLDRSNLGNARVLSGLHDGKPALPKDALGGDPTGVLYDWVNSAFFFAYIIFQVPATICSKLVAPHIWLSIVAIGWGTTSTLMSTGFDFGGLMTARVFLGIFEAGFGPAIPLYFSLFYTKEEMGLIMAYWFGFAAIAGAFGGIIAFGIQNAILPFSNWRLLFIVEGIPAVCLGIATFFFLPDRPESTRYLNEREREIALARMNRGTSGDVGAVVNKAHIWMAFRDWRIYCGGVIYFALNCSLASTSAFLPTILETFGISNSKVQLMTIPPYAVAAVVLALSSWTSDKLQSRGIPISMAAFVGGVGYLILLVVPTNLHARYFATFCITSGTYTCIGLIIAWFAHNLGSETKKATGIPMFMAIGQCGSILGSHLFPATEGPRYIKGFAVCCGLEFFGVICTIIMTISYRMENTRRDKEYGIPQKDARVDVALLADKAPSFRYTV